MYRAMSFCHTPRNGDGTINLYCSVVRVRMKGSFLNIALIVRFLVALAKLGELLLVGGF